MTTMPEAKRVPGWVLLAFVLLFVGAVGLLIVRSAR